MIPYARLPLVVILGLGLMATLGLVFGHLPPLYADLSQVIWLTVLIELLVYFLAVLVSNPAVGTGRALVLSLFLCLTRLLVSGFSGMALVLFADLPLEEATLRAWVGNSVGVLSQGILLMLVAPHALQALAPGLITETMAEALENRQPRLPSKPASRLARIEGGRGTVEPTGGFIQVFSLTELQSLFRKSVGMEGYILYTSEGLIFWKDMPIRLDVDALVARAHALGDTMGGVIEGFGLTRVRKIVYESREHYLFHTRLNPNFGLIMIFASSVNIEDCWTRLGIMARTSKEFLQWKYPNLGSLRQSSSSRSEA